MNLDATTSCLRKDYSNKWLLKNVNVFYSTIHKLVTVLMGALNSTLVIVRLSGVAYNWVKYIFKKCDN